MFANFVDANSGNPISINPTGVLWVSDAGSSLRAESRLTLMTGVTIEVVGKVEFVCETLKKSQIAMCLAIGEAATATLRENRRAEEESCPTP